MSSCSKLFIHTKCYKKSISNIQVTNSSVYIECSKSVVIRYIYKLFKELIDDSLLDDEDDYISS